MQKFNLVAATILGTSLSIGLAAAMPAAHAVSLIPQQEGEIGLTNLTSVSSTTIDTTSMGFNVTSLQFDSKLGLSRLFVDKNGTENTWGLGIKFGATDLGTNPNSSQYWYRPVAIGTDNKVLEGGQLEVGRFLFNLDKTYEEVSLDFVDVEDNGFSGILEVNGQSVSNLLNAGPNDGTQSLTLKNVKSFVVQMGNSGKNYSNPNARFATGDGVRLSGLGVTKAVPEPTTTLGLGAMAVAGLLGLRRKKASQVG
ncbi:PEP-CTERM sorting domain-containing protein [Scytonema sp. UIC 10036]|uniref:LEVG family PEP-CTERM protein n=1 Tax=Scytonema sp. UIC 10036 TaxID=2304196 RepID=UPI0012DA53B7|nr:LEVG family PEP-CTERM protein [Scytonema sp. UIC 10036]MUG97049.1 PEP-CTERM sorting domain-containing protein [Scytonema sp. UIC 10036]